MAADVLPVPFTTPTFPWCAIIFPPSCLAPSPLASASQSVLERLPEDLLITILDNVTITSRVNLAVTCKSLAITLNRLPSILNLELRRLSANTLRLLEQDEGIRHWAPLHLELPLKPQWDYDGKPLITVIHLENVDLKCTRCDQAIERPQLDIPFGPHSKVDFAWLHLQEVNKRGFRQYILMHARQHVGALGRRGRLFTQAMLTLVDVSITEKIRKEGLKWTKAAVLCWVLARSRRS